MRYYFIICRMSNTAKNRAVQSLKDLIQPFDQMVISELQLPDIISHFEDHRIALNRKFKNCGEMKASFTSPKLGSHSKMPMYDFCECFCVSFAEINQIQPVVKAKTVQFDPACVTQLCLF